MSAVSSALGSVQVRGNRKQILILIPNANNRVCVRHVQARKAYFERCRVLTSAAQHSEDDIYQKVTRGRTFETFVKENK